MKYYIVDAFNDKVFKGNAAGVCLLEEPLEEGIMQNIASENNLAETAFLLKQGDIYSLRWFTPEHEIDLCGHATLASAYVLFRFMENGAEPLSFTTRSGILKVKKNGETLELDFPSRPPKEITVTDLMKKAVGGKVLEAYLARDLVLVLENEKQVEQTVLDLKLAAQIPDYYGIIITAKGEEADFVSRFFSPNAGMSEDPVTGSAHSTLIPFWSKRLNKKKMLAYQLSKRGGILHCQDKGERVGIAGTAVLYLTGEIHI